MIITLKGANFASSNIGTLDSWLISKSLTGVTIDNTATSVKKGEAYKAVITLKENYTFPDIITVTMGGTDITSTYVTKTATTITVNVPSVTGNIVIRVNATSNVVGVTYSITRTLTALTAGSSVNTITSGDTYEETFSIPKDMYDGNISGSGVEVDFTITMGGTELDGTGVTAEYVYTSPDGSERTTGFKITVPNVNGNIVITAISYVPFDESVEATKVHRYDEDDKSIDIDSISIGSPIMYSAVDGARVYGWRIPAGSRITLTFNATSQIANAEAMVLLHKTTYAVLEYASTYRASLGLGPDGKPLPLPNTHTFTNVYNDDVLLEANEGVIVSGEYTVVGGGISPGGGIEPSATRLSSYGSAITEPSKLAANAYIANVQNAFSSGATINYIEFPVANSTTKKYYKDGEPVTIPSVSVWVFDKETNTPMEKLVDEQSFTTALSTNDNYDCHTIVVPINRTFNYGCYFGFSNTPSAGNIALAYGNVAGNYLSGTSFEIGTPIVPGQSYAIPCSIYGTGSIYVAPDDVDDLNQVCYYNNTASSVLAGNCYVASKTQTIPANTNIKVIDIMAKGSTVEGINLYVVNANTNVIEEMLLDEASKDTVISTRIGGKAVIRLELDKTYDHPIYFMFNADRPSNSSSGMLMKSGVSDAILLTDDERKPAVGDNLTDEEWKSGYNIGFAVYN